MAQTQTSSRITISGNTYPVKDQIKALGGRWDADRKVWTVPADRAAEAQALVAGAPKGYVAGGSSRASSSGRCGKCGDPLSAYEQRRGFRRCLECVGGGSNYRDGQSYYDRNGNYVLGDDD